MIGGGDRLSRAHGDAEGTAARAPARRGCGRAPGRPARGQKSWALLARVALADRPVTRAELAAELFGEADDPLGALRWCLADLRRCCQDPALFRGDPVQAGQDGPWLDVRALAAGTLPAAEIGGRLLDGVELSNCPAFDLWLMLARGRCAARSAEELRRAALNLLGTGDAEAAIEPAGRAATLDPLDEGAQELLLRALVAAGHPARAAVHLNWCEALFSREGLTPSPALRSAALASAPSPPVGLRAAVIAGSLLPAGKAALDAGSADAGVETLRQAARQAERSIALGERERWPAFVPWPQALRAHCLQAAGRPDEARDDAEQAFALACQLGDPCWEGMAGRALAMLALGHGDDAAAGQWIVDAQQRCDRLPDRYAWVSGFVGLGHLEIAAQHQPELVAPLARRLYQNALRADLPEFIAWALVHLAEAGDQSSRSLACSVAAPVVNPALRARVAALGG